MRKMTADIVIIGAGPAGLCAARQAASAGADVLVADENKLPGGQLFKQIHKFFGSREHNAGTRGYKIGYQLLEQVEKSGARILLDSLIYGLFPSGPADTGPDSAEAAYSAADISLGLIHKERSYSLEAKKIIIAAGARENYLAFPGSTLPGVMGAGAAQTLINLHRVLPGKRVVMIGSGNVGLIVAYQLLQAGAEVAAILEAAPRIGGYGVHAAKLRRAGVPILTSHTVSRAAGDGELEKVEITALGEKGPIPGSEKTIEADTICLAVGLTPMTELAWMSGCRFAYIPDFGGHVPLHTGDMETTVPGVYVAGDITGIEEASTAMEEGNLAGIAAAGSLGFLSREEAEQKKREVLGRLDKLRSGDFGQVRRESKAGQIAAMDEFIRGGAAVMSGGDRRGGAGMEPGGKSLAYTGVPSKSELASCPGIPGAERLGRGRVAVIECIQHIPCNPCVDACPFGAITLKGSITGLPELNGEICTGCGTCVPRCPGLAIFLVDMTYSKTEATVDFPYEYLPLPRKGDTVDAVNRAGEKVCAARVLELRHSPGHDGTAVIRLAVPKEQAGEVRSMRRVRGNLES